MRIVFTPDEVKMALKALRDQFTAALGPPRAGVWTVPPATAIQLDTWRVLGKPTLGAIGFGRPMNKRKCMYLFLASDGGSSVLTPTVEVNIPDGGTTPDRKTQGCICDEGTPGNSTFWIGHRGTRLTVAGDQRIEKEEIQREMRESVRDGIQDGDKKSEIIVIGQIGPTLVSKLDSFVEAVQRLKQSWSPKP